MIPFPEGVQFLGRAGISTYSIFLMLAFLSCSFLGVHEFKRRGLNPATADWLVFLSIIGTIVGAKVFFVIQIWPQIWIIDTGFWDTCYRVFFTWKGMSYAGGTSMWGTLFSGSGLVFYGGFIGSMALILLYLRKNKLNVAQHLDVAAVTLSLGYGIGRLACFVSGDGCYGYSSGGISIPLLTWVYGPETGGCPSDPSLLWKYPFMCSDGVRVWNTPVIESLLSLCLFGFYMLWARYKPFRPGMLVCIFFVWNGLIRFLLEFLRLNDAVIPIRKSPSYLSAGPGSPEIPLKNFLYLHSHPDAAYFENWHWYGFTQGQIIAIFLIITGITLIIVKKLYQYTPQTTK